MRYALVSDIHANIQAWNAVLLDIRENDVDRIICLGDIVGYGPNPAETLESVYANVELFVLGNHDAVICGKMSSECFNDTAGYAIRWTQTAVNCNASALLSKIPLSLIGDNFRCCHGSFVNPGRFDYILCGEDARNSFDAVPEQLLFCGHTHVPELYVLGDSGVPHRLHSQDFVLESNKRYIVNVGSVGNPRSGDPAASYCIYDSDTKAVLWRSIPFDLYAYKQALVEKKLPLETSAFLQFDSRIEQPPVREQISFVPPEVMNRNMQKTAESENINQLKKSVRLWRFIAASAIIIIPLVIALLSILIFFKNDSQDIIGASNFMPVNATSAPFDKNLLPDFHSATNEFTSNIRITLENKEYQQYSFFKEGDLQGIRFQSFSEDAEIQIIFPPFRNINADTKFCIEGFFKKSDDFQGEIALKVLVKKQGKKSFETMFVKPPNPNFIRKGGWICAKQTFTVEEDVEVMQSMLSGQFTGSVQVGKIELEKLNDQ